MRDLVIAACGLAIVALLAVIAYQDYRRFHKPLLTTTFQAVTLVNGEVFYGRIDHLGTDHPVLRDAFSIRTEIEPQSQQEKRVIVRRSDSLTGADHLIFPAASIASVEPVKADSAVGKLIKEAGLSQ
jgi:hypothetical protein